METWQASLCADAGQRNIRAIATAFMPTGPVRDLVTGDWPDALRLYEVVRPYDRAVWPNANAGFFRLKKEIPRLLQELRQTR